jgi:hypothetical protein
LLLHVAVRDFDVFTVTDSHFGAAGNLVVRHGFNRRLRTLDALQLAVAVDLRLQALVDHFVAADKCTSVMNPESP